MKKTWQLIAALCLSVICFALLPLNSYAEDPFLQNSGGVHYYTGWPIQIMYSDALCLVFKCNPDILPEKVKEVNDLLVKAIGREIHELDFNHPAKQQNKYITVRLEDGGWLYPKLSANAAGMVEVLEGFPVMYINPYLDSEVLEKTIAHELFHVIQLSYDPRLIGAYEELNFSEGTAVWMERRLFEFDKYWYKKDFLDLIKYYYLSPQRSILGTNPLDKFFQYGTVVWPIYLEYQFKDKVIKEIWEAYFEEAKAKNNYYVALYSAFDKVLKQHNTNIEEAYRDFIRWIFDKSRWRRDASAYSDVSYSLEIKEYPTGWIGLKDELDYPSVLGSSFIKFTTKKSLGDFVFNFYGAKEAKWGIDLYVGSGSSFSYLARYSATISKGYGKEKQFVIPANKLQTSLVAIISPLDSNELDTEDRPFDYYYKFQLNAGYQTPVIDQVSPTKTVSNESQKKETAIVNQNQTKELSASEETSVIMETDIFSDVNESYKYAVPIKYLKDNGVINGYPDGTFRPKGSINRAELIKILIGNNLPDGTYNNCFSDVHEEWFAPYVCYAKSQGWISGYSNGTFKPAQEVNRAEAMKMAIEFFQLQLPVQLSEDPYRDVNKGAWFAPYLAVAKEKGLLDKNIRFYQPSANMNREIMGDIIYRLMTMK